MDGILLINKQQDWTSFDVVNYLKRKLNIKKIGHLGTLDPMATGVLPVALGKATKLFNSFLNCKKEYVAQFTFGYLTDSLDATGNVVSTGGTIPRQKQIEQAVQTFVGITEQMPPQFSAKKINGVPAYKMARKGEFVELKPKQIEIFEFKILNYKDAVLTVKIVCSSGTYIRSIARDLAESLGTYATMTSLVRSAAGNFLLENCVDVKQVDLSNIQNFLIVTD